MWDLISGAASDADQKQLLGLLRLLDTKAGALLFTGHPIPGVVAVTGRGRSFGPAVESQPYPAASVARRTGDLCIHHISLRTPRSRVDPYRDIRALWATRRAGPNRSTR